jgi:hypothetical protein
METIINFLEAIPWYIWVIIVVGIPMALGIGSYLFPGPERDSQRPSSPLSTYTAQNIQAHKVYLIESPCENGHSYCQQFQVLNIRADGWFMIGVYFPGGQAEGQGHFAFTGWTRQLSSSQRIFPQNLIQEIKSRDILPA